MSRPKMGFKKVRIGYVVRRMNETRPKWAMWDGKGQRAPRKGELYLSGCEGFEVAYEAPNDLSSLYFIAEPVREG